MTVEVNHQVYSSESGGVQIEGQPNDTQRPSFICMNPPKRDEPRKVASSIVAPGNLMNMEESIRERTGRVLDSLPRGETFDWVQHVSINLTRNVSPN
jgi:cytochrome P450